MQVLKTTAERTKRVWNYISLVFSPISFAIMAGYKSNWALLQHYSDFFFISVFYHQHLCVGCKPLILKMVTTLRIQTTPKNAIKCEIWYCNKSLPSNFVPNTMWVSPLSSNTSMMGPIYKSTLLFGLLASKNPQFEKVSPSWKIPVIGVQMLNQPTLFPSSSQPNEKIYFRFISMFLFWNGLFSSHFWVGGLFLLHSVLNCSLSKRSRVRN